MKFPLFRLLKLGNGIKQEECFMPYLIVAVVVVIFIAVVFIVAGKDSKERIDMVSKLTEEQRNILMSTEVNFVEKNAWVQKAMVAKMKDKGNKIDIRLLWFNEVLQNNDIIKLQWRM